MPLLVLVFALNTVFASELTDKAVAQFKEAAKADTDVSRAKWNFFEDGEMRATVAITLRNETNRTAAALKFLEARVKPAIPEKDWELLKDRIERAGAAAASNSPPPPGDTHGQAFRYSTEAGMQMERLWVRFKSPRASADELRRKAEMQAHVREAEGRAKAADKPRAPARTGE